MRKMKKTTRFLAVGLILILIVSGCASKKSAEETSVAYDTATMTNEASSPMEPMMDGNVEYDMAMPESENKANYATGSTGQIVSNQQKIITVTYEMETLTFEETSIKIADLLQSYNGYIQNSQQTGAGRNANQKNRFAYFEMRIPSELVNGFMKELRTYGNLLSEYVQSEDVTAVLADNDARLKSLKQEEDSLLAILAKATKLEEVITLESRLSEVRYQIESIESSQRHIKDQVAYSTVKINLYEVYEVTIDEPVAVTFFEKLAEAFKDSISNFTEFLEVIVLSITESIFFILLWIAILFGGYKLLSSIQKKERAKSLAVKQAKEEKVAINLVSDKSARDNNVDNIQK